MSNKEQIINSIQETLKQVKSMVETETIIGNKIQTEDGSCIIPVSKVIVGYVGGGGEYFDAKVKKQENPFATGCGTGAYIKPLGFLILNKDGSSKYIEVEKENQIEKIAEYVLNIIDNLKNKGEKNEK